MLDATRDGVDTSLVASVLPAAAPVHDLDALGEALVHPAAPMRAAAASAVGRTGTRAQRLAFSAPLATLARTDPHPEVRREAVRVLGSLRLAGTRETLMRATEDPDEQVRAEAQRALARDGRR